MRARCHAVRRRDARARAPIVRLRDGYALRARRAVDKSQRGAYATVPAELEDVAAPVGAT